MGSRALREHPPPALAQCFVRPRLPAGVGYRHRRQRSLPASANARIALAALPAPGSSAAAPCRSVARVWLSRPHALLPVTMPAHNGTSCVHAAGHLGGSALVTWRSCGLPRGSHAKSSSSGRRLRLRPGRWQAGGQSGGRACEAGADAIIIRAAVPVDGGAAGAVVRGLGRAFLYLSIYLVGCFGRRPRCSGSGSASGCYDVDWQVNVSWVSVFVIKLSIYLSKCGGDFGPALSPQTSRPDGRAAGSGGAR